MIITIKERSSYLYFLETERLYIRKFKEEDHEFLYNLMNTPQYIQNIGDGNIKNISDAKDFIKNKLMQSYHDFGYGLYAVVEKSSKNLIGMSGFVNRESLPFSDIGFAFLPLYMGKGFAYESSKSLMNYAQSELKLSPILGITAKSNHSSQKLLNKLGLYFIKPITLDGESEEIMLYSNIEEN